MRTPTRVVLAARAVPPAMGTLASRAFDSPVQQIVFQEYVDSAREATRRVADLEDPIRTAAKDWSLPPGI
ncbi:MAG: hypothetical protein OXC91_01310 [Rhodobacteraceae bacterium]|nr:hypothetical protein [Paracoccaceae bacterium]